MAAALAVSLTESRGDIVEGFKLFRESRGRRVWQVAHASAQMGLIYHLPQPFDMVRDLVIRLSSGYGLLERMTGFTARKAVAWQEAERRCAPGMPRMMQSREHGGFSMEPYAGMRQAGRRFLSDGSASDVEVRARLS